MLAVDYRAGLLGGVCGLGVGAGAFLLAAVASPDRSNLGDLEHHLGAPVAQGQPETMTGRLQTLLSRPLFPALNGAGASQEINVQLQGISISRGRQAALISIAGKPPVWLTVGQAAGGATVLEVRTTAVLLDTPTGTRTISLSPASARPARPGAEPPPALGVSKPPAGAPDAALDGAIPKSTDGPLGSPSQHQSGLGG